MNELLQELETNCFKLDQSIIKYNDIKEYKKIFKFVYSVALDEYKNNIANNIATLIYTLKQIQKYYKIDNNQISKLIKEMENENEN